MAKFKKGQSGNPAGRRKGTSQADKLRQAIEKDLPEIIETLAEAAKSGDTAAAKLLLDRAIPAFKPQGVTASVSGLSGKPLSGQGSIIIEAVGCGELSPEQGQSMLAGLASLSRIKEVDELERRLTKLEEAQKI